jgi:hypothetical protein
MGLGFTITNQNPNSSQNMDRSQLFRPKEDKVSSISRKGHGIDVLGC